MKMRPHPHTRWLVGAASLSLVGQITAIGFMLWTNPFTTLIFMTGGVGMIILGMLLFGWVMVRDFMARARSLSEQDHRAGDFIFRQGDVGDRIYIVTAGEVEVVRHDPEKGDLVLARLGKGDFFGEMALLSDAPRNASVRAAGDARTLSIMRDDFLSLYSSIPAFHESVLSTMSRRQ